jgi:NitT/TauT family transport system ATP-binding protein
MKTRLKLIDGMASAERGPRVLELAGASKVFPIPGGFFTAFENLTFSARSGEFLAVTGPSGCGKSTLLKVIAGFLKADAGRVSISGSPVKGPGADRCMVFQEDALFPWLSVYENVAFGLSRRGLTKKQIKERVTHFLELVALFPFGRYLPAEISGGMRQRVALARVLVLEPLVLLMDEPFASLDMQTRQEMQELLVSLWKELDQTIVFVTHDVSEALGLADRILIMKGSPGRIQDDIPVHLPRPRPADSPAFLRLAVKVREKLKPGA